MKIPEQLKGLRFNRVRFKEKRAFENGWQKKPYTYDQIHNYFPGENYGVICGKDIRALDDDTPTEMLKKLYNDNFNQTMEVRGHIYFKFDNQSSKKIIFNHPTSLFPNSKGKLESHMGELQGEATYVVGPNSTHPSGELYELKKDLPIATISYDKFMEVFKDYIIRKSVVIREHVHVDWEGDNINNIPISNVASFAGLIDKGNGCYQGPHPIHGSTGGMNFIIDTFNNTWYCFRCQSGGGPSELISVVEGIMDCSSIGPSCYTEEQGKEIIQIAREKYGLSVPEQQQDLGEVTGWANSVNIVKLAKRNNFESCKKCNNAFKFRESHGLFYCNSCKYGGGLTKFAELIVEASLKLNNGK